MWVFLVVLFTYILVVIDGIILISSTFWLFLQGEKDYFAFSTSKTSYLLMQVECNLSFESGLSAFSTTRTFRLLT